MLRRRSIRMRIIVLVLVPVIALIGLYAVALALTLNSFLTVDQADRRSAPVVSRARPCAGISG